MRKMITLIILTSMLLHCMSRLGVVDYIFKQRHSIAHTLGLIEEIPMAMCTSDYVGDVGLIYIDSDAQTQEPTLPMQVAQEIQLFLFPQTIIMQPTSTQMISIHSTRYGDNYMFIHTSGVFHPPSFA